MVQGYNSGSFKPGNVGSSSHDSSGLGKFVRSEAFRSVLNGLGIDPKNITDSKITKGLSQKLQFQEVEVIQINSDMSEVLKSLGLANVDLAVMLNADEEMDRIKKRLKEVRLSSLDPELLSEMATAFGVDFDDDTLIFTDKVGGILIVKSSLQEIERTLE